MTSPVHRSLVRLSGVLLCCAGFSARAETTTSKPFKGITLHQRSETSPRPFRINVIEIDLKAPGIRFRVTPPNGNLPGETTLQTTRDFLIEQRAQLAINGSFYKTIDKTYGDTGGLTASDGVTYSQFTIFPTLNLSPTNVPSILTQAPRDQSGVKPAEQVEVYNAISGNELIVRDGKNVAADQRLHPRTAAGYTTDHRLILVTVDGRQKGFSEGMTTPEVADVLIGYGVTQALNLDGGGSTTLAMADPQPRIVNVPVGIDDKPGTQRRNASNLAVFAEPAEKR